ncbi:hypothetical protein QAD02_017589 [Eretmocerus hayati]|uniref:Uncharacterized protein n=1 Tax=Eretmocerus hayati TaxID=131215 RepID=A0ACC2PEB9_9HYME|nr:hypothetical protein QAD02_017589 [Eretmocerus hayati]
MSQRKNEKVPTSKLNYRVESVRIMLFVQCVFEHDNKISIVPASYVRYDKNSRTHLQAKHKFDFDGNHKYQVKWYSCNSQGKKCDKTSCRHEFSEWPAKLKVLGETPIAVQRNAKELKRIKFVPAKLKKTTSESDSVVNQTQERCQELLQMQKRKDDVKLAASKHESRKQLDIWNARNPGHTSSAQRSLSNSWNISETCTIPQSSAGDLPLSTASTVNFFKDTSSNLSSQDKIHKMSKSFPKKSNCQVDNRPHFMDSHQDHGQVVTQSKHHVSISNESNSDGVETLQRMIDEEETRRLKKQNKKRKQVKGVNGNSGCSSPSILESHDISLATPHNSKSMNRLESSRSISPEINQSGTADSNAFYQCGGNSARASTSYPLSPSTSTHQSYVNRCTVQNEVYESNVAQSEQVHAEVHPIPTRLCPQENISLTTRSREPNEYMKRVQRLIKGYDFDPRSSGDGKRPPRRRSALVVNAITAYKDKSRPEYIDYRKRYKVAKGMTQLGQGVAVHPISLTVMEASVSPEKYLKSLVLHYFTKDELAQYSFEPEQVPQHCWIPGGSQPQQFPRNKLDLILSLYDDYLHKKFDDQHASERIRFLLKAVDDISRWMRRERQRLREAALLGDGV